METTHLLSPHLFASGPYHDSSRRIPKPAEYADVYASPPQEPNFRVDDLLDFSNDEELCEELPAASSSIETEAQAPSVSGGKDLNCPRSSSALQDACQQASGGLCVPSDELADQLEWLSTFNEDSSYSGDRKLASLVSSGSLSGLKESQSSKAHDKFQSSSPVSVLEPSGGLYANSYPTSSNHVPSRARSKRPRSGTRVWSLDALMPTLVDNRLGGAQESPVFFGCPPESEPFFPSKKAKKATPVFKPLVEAPPRRCSHCLVQKTPQWRAGPMGPKTLCNACGVRYKSGRLVPEYRPAGSPSFITEVHSNSHKRILEMRRIKEVEEQVAVGKEEEEEDAEDCHSQTKPCKEVRREDPNAPICSEESQEDSIGPICSEEVSNSTKEEELIDPVCSKEDSISPTSTNDQCKGQERPTMVEYKQQEDSKEDIAIEQKEDSNEESINSVN